MVYRSGLRPLDRILLNGRCRDILNFAWPTIRNIKMGTLEKIAAAASAAIILTAAVYWIIQIRGVMEMLELAYG